MTAEIIPIGRAMQRLRSPDAEKARQRRIGVQRTAAYRRALNLEYSAADVAMFGPMDELLKQGIGRDPRLDGLNPPHPPFAP